MNEVASTNGSNGNGANSLPQTATAEFHPPLPQSDEGEIEAGMRRVRETKRRLEDALDTLGKRDVRIRELEAILDAKDAQIAVMESRAATAQAERDEAVTARAKLSTLLEAMEDFWTRAKAIAAREGEGT